MKDLIEALQIFMKYQPPDRSPTTCEHDVLYVVGIERGVVSAADVQRLDELGFFWSEEDEVWMSFRFGSA